MVDRNQSPCPPALLVNWFDRNSKTHVLPVWRCTGADSNSCVTCVTCVKLHETAVSKLMHCMPQSAVNCCIQTPSLLEHSQHFYWPSTARAPSCLSSEVKKKSGVLIWKERSNLCAAHLTMQWSAGVKICKTVWALSCLTSEVQRYSMYEFETNDQNSCAAHLKMYWGAGFILMCNMHQLT